MAVIDGGVTGQADGATMAEAAFIARIIGMKDAVCLSSGDASTLWSEDGGVVSHPSGNGIYDNTGEDEKLALRIHKAVKKQALSGFRDNQVVVRRIKKALFEILGDDSEVERIYNIIEKQEEY